MRHTRQHPSSELPAITLKIADGCRITGADRSKLCQLISAGEIAVEVDAITFSPMTSCHTPVDGRRATSEQAFGARLRLVMHPFLANAILTAALANAPVEVRRDFSSSDATRREKAEDRLVERLVAAIYAADEDTNPGPQ